MLGWVYCVNDSVNSCNSSLFVFSNVAFLFVLRVTSCDLMQKNKNKRVFMTFFSFSFKK